MYKKIIGKFTAKESYINQAVSEILSYRKIFAYLPIRDKHIQSIYLEKNISKSLKLFCSINFFLLKDTFYL